MKAIHYFLKFLRKSTGFGQENDIFLREFKHFSRIALLALIFSFLASSSDGIGIGLLLSFLQSLITPNAQETQTGIAWFDIWVLGINETATYRLYRLSVLIVLITWLRSGFLYLEGLYVGLTQVTLIDRLRKQLFEQLQRLSLSYFAQIRSGELINSLTTEINKLWIPFELLATLINKGISLCVYVVAIFLLSWQLAIVSVLAFSLLSVGLSTLRKQVRESSFETTKANGYFTSVAVEFLSGIFTVHAFNTQDFERRRFYQASSEIKRAIVKGISNGSLGVAFAEGIAITILIIIIFLGFAAFNTPIPALLTFMFALLRLVPAVKEINRAVTGLSGCQGSLNNIKELLRTDDKPYFQNGKVQFSGLKGSIEFISVDFSYNGTLPALSDISLEMQKGQLTALVGSSGAGKTTLAALIPRFFDPQQGQILIDGIELRSFEIGSLRRQIAVVSQETFIFNTSVRENIAYGSEAADEAAIWQAAQFANALEFIKELPEGFDTQLGDRGVKLSGGQRQRIAIARALLRDPEILILDEATSALDSVSERLIQEALEKVSVNRTVIAIAHRLSTIAKADQVIVLEQGRIVEQGSYQELIQQRGKLWYYHQLQHGTN
jgi:ABC-type multidrug transport system fused ATPase/permease subunit